MQLTWLVASLFHVIYDATHLIDNDHDLGCSCAYTMCGAFDLDVRPLTLPISIEFLSRQRGHRARRDCTAATIVETPGEKVNSYYI